MLKRKAKQTPLDLGKKKPALFGKRAAITAIDIDGDTVYAVTVSGSGAGLRFSKAVSGEIEWPKERGQPAADGLALKKALDAIRVKPKEAVMGLPRGQVVLRPLQAPMAGDLRELASVVNFQIARDLPFRIEEAVVDFKVLRVVEVAVPAEETAPADKSAAPAEPAKQQRLELLVGAVKSDIVKYYQELAKAAGFKLAGLGLLSGGHARALQLSGAANPKEAVFLLALRETEITIDIVLEEKLVFSRVAGPPLAPGEDHEAALQTLAVEVVRSLHGFEGMMWQTQVTAGVISGGTGSETRLSTLLAERLGIPVSIMDARALLGSRGDESVTSNFAAVLGLGHSFMSPAGLPLDFANPKKPAAANNSARTRKLLGIAAILLVMISIFAIRANMVKKRQAIRTAAQAELTDAEKKAPIYRKLKAQAKVVNGWLGEDQNWLDHLAYLSGILPPADQLYVSAINTTPQHIIRISLQAKTGELLAELDKKLRAAGYEVKPLSITPANDKYGYSFRTTVELVIPKKMKPDSSKVKPPPRPADDASPKSTANNSSTRGSARPS